MSEQVIANQAQDGQIRPQIEGMPWGVPAHVASANGFHNGTYVRSENEVVPNVRLETAEVAAPARELSDAEKQIAAGQGSLWGDNPNGPSAEQQVVAEQQHRVRGYENMLDPRRMYELKVNVDKAAEKARKERVMPFDQRSQNTQNAETDTEADRARARVVSNYVAAQAKRQGVTGEVPSTLTDEINRQMGQSQSVLEAVAANDTEDAANQRAKLVADAVAEAERKIEERARQTREDHEKRTMSQREQAERNKQIGHSPVASSRELPAQAQTDHDQNGNARREVPVTEYNPDQNVDILKVMAAGGYNTQDGVQYNPDQDVSILKEMAGQDADDSLLPASNFLTGQVIRDADDDEQLNEDEELDADDSLLPASNFLTGQVIRDADDDEQLNEDEELDADDSLLPASNFISGQVIHDDDDPTDSDVFPAPNGGITPRAVPIGNRGTHPNGAGNNPNALVGNFDQAMQLAYDNWVNHLATQSAGHLADLNRGNRFRRLVNNVLHPIHAVQRSRANREQQVLQDTFRTQLNRHVNSRVNLAGQAQLVDRNTEGAGVTESRAIAMRLAVDDMVMADVEQRMKDNALAAEGYNSNRPTGNSLGDRNTRRRQRLVEHMADSWFDDGGYPNRFGIRESLINGGVSGAATALPLAIGGMLLGVPGVNVLAGAGGIATVVGANVAQHRVAEAVNRGRMANDNGVAEYETFRDNGRDVNLTNAQNAPRDHTKYDITRGQVVALEQNRRANFNRTRAVRWMGGTAAAVAGVAAAGGAELAGDAFGAIGNAIHHAQGGHTANANNTVARATEKPEATATATSTGTKVTGGSGSGTPGSNPVTGPNVNLNNPQVPYQMASQEALAHNIPAGQIPRYDLNLINQGVQWAHQHGINLVRVNHGLIPGTKTPDWWLEVQRTVNGRTVVEPMNKTQQAAFDFLLKAIAEGQKIPTNLPLAA